MRRTLLLAALGALVGAAACRWTGSPPSAATPHQPARMAADAAPTLPDPEDCGQGDGKCISCPSYCRALIPGYRLNGYAAGYDYTTKPFRIWRHDASACACPS